MTHDTATTGTRTARGTLGRLSVRHLGIIALAFGVALLALFGPTPSSAIFTSSTGAGGQVAAASDWTPPTVSVTAPTGWVKDVVTVQIVASDSEGPVDRVVLERLATGSNTWVTVCTDTSAPFSCAWDTRGLTDGEYSLRARATDRAGLETTSAVVRTTVANQVTAVLKVPDTASQNQVRGTVTLTASVANIGALAHTVRIQQADPGTSTWTTICTDLRSPYSCNWDTTTVASGGRDLRAVVVGSDGRTLTTSAVVTVTVDNVAPSITLTDPGTPLSGTRTFATTANDAHTGVKRVVVQSSPTGTSVWSDLCTATASPWTCQVATGTLVDGSYSFRAVATDGAGNTATSAVVSNRLVENAAPAVTLTALPATLQGTMQIGATASSVPGVTSVKVQYQRSGTATWTDICTDTSAPYACVWDTMPLTNGTYALRAVMIDALGRTTTSAVLSRPLENRPFAGLDVQTFNGAVSTAGKADEGDSVVFTFSHQIAPSSVMAGWDGKPATVALRVNDPSGSLVRPSLEDVLNVWTVGGAPINLGTVNLKGDYIWAGRTAEFESLMTLSTVPANDGTLQSTVTLQLGSAPWVDRTALKTAGPSEAAAMVWAPSSLVQDIFGRPSSPNPVTETGTLDREF